MEIKKIYPEKSANRDKCKKVRGRKSFIEGVKAESQTVFKVKTKYKQKAKTQKNYIPPLKMKVQGLIWVGFVMLTQLGWQPRPDLGHQGGGRHQSYTEVVKR